MLFEKKEQNTKGTDMARSIKHNILPCQIIVIHGYIDIYLLDVGESRQTL